MQRLTAYGFIFIGWANTAFYWLGNAATSRALSLGDNPLGASNLFGMVGYCLAFIGAILIVWLLGYLALEEVMVTAQKREESLQDARSFVINPDPTSRSFSGDPDEDFDNTSYTPGLNYFRPFGFGNLDVSL